MALTLDQALHQGVAAHKEGKLQDAERLYRAILQVQPRHPDANHNLGVLAIAVGKPLEAIPLLKLALDANPKTEQFWLSYVDVLIKLERFDEAKRALVEGEKSDVAPEKLEALNQRLKENVPDGPDKTAKDQTLSEKRKKLAEEKKSKKEKKQDSSSSAEPSQDEINRLLEHYQAGRLEVAEALAISLTQQFPKHPFGWKALGAVFKKMDRLSDSLAPKQKAAELSPHDADAHYNLGNTLKGLGRFEQSVASYSQAIALKPDLDDAYVSLSEAIRNVKFSSSSPTLYQPLLQLLTKGNFARPSAVASPILSLLKHDPLIKDLLIESLGALSLQEAAFIVESLHKLPLLHQLMRFCPLPDLQFERFLSNIRRFLLANRNKVEESPELIYFLSTLSIHCFVNEYVYAESEEEIYLVEELEDKITQAVEYSMQPDAVTILCLASYRPLHQYESCQKLEALEKLNDVKMVLIEEPLAEQLIAKKIPAREEIFDDISRKVREQYEKNPYPRWIKTGIPIKAKSISEVCADLSLNLRSERIKEITAPEILVAGCGTGQHSITTACRFANCQVTAVDLSCASIAYAQRKTNELGVTNLEYWQADILQLDQLNREFDIIESKGVLHHMKEPMAGWRILSDMLKPGGLMSIGLYSELARQPIVGVRKEIESLRVGTSESDIRKFRGYLAESHNESHKLLTEWPDFFSLSELRDLIFHVQEHRFTLLKIHKSLDELGLVFCGFENTAFVKQFKSFFGEDADACDLSLWHQLEQKNPRAFSGMYQFWCQKI